jgi:hypothetical protein
VLPIDNSTYLPEKMSGSHPSSVPGELFARIDTRPVVMKRRDFLPKNSPTACPSGPRTGAKTFGWEKMASEPHLREAAAACDCTAVQQETRTRSKKLAGPVGPGTTAWTRIGEDVAARFDGVREHGRDSPCSSDTSFGVDTDLADLMANAARLVGASGAPAEDVSTLFHIAVAHCVAGATPVGSPQRCAGRLPCLVAAAQGVSASELATARELVDTARVQAFDHARRGAQCLESLVSACLPGVVEPHVVGSHDRSSTALQHVMGVPNQALVLAKCVSRLTHMGHDDPPGGGTLSNRANKHNKTRKCVIGRALAGLSTHLVEVGATWGDSFPADCVARETLELVCRHLAEPSTPEYDDDDDDDCTHVEWSSAGSRSVTTHRRWSLSSMSTRTASEASVVGMPSFPVEDAPPGTRLPLSFHLAN